METKIKIKPIADVDTDVEINSPEHRIEEIKRELQEPLEEESKAEVLEMFEK